MAACWIYTIILIGFTIYGQTQILPVKNLEIYRLYIHSEVAFRFATTNVTSYIANNADSAHEAQFKVTLPKGAFIANFSMVIDGVLYEGNVKEKAQAQKQYDKAKKKGHSAGQVKAKSPKESNVFQVQVNVAARSKVEFSLTYQELLRRRLGLYENVINIDPGQVVRELKVRVDLQESRKITVLQVPELRTSYQNLIQLPENSIAVIDRLNGQNARITYEPDVNDQLEASANGIAGQFIVQYDVERDLSGGEIQVVDGYFVHYFAPSGLEPVTKSILFILDISGSMSADKLSQTKLAMKTILDDLHEGDDFNIITFSDYVNYWKEGEMAGVSSEAVAEAKVFIDNMSAGGGTNINDALIKGSEFLKQQREKNRYESRPSILIFLTDGQPSSGVTNIAQIMENVRNENQGASALFTLGFGNDVDFPFLTKMSLQNDGFARKIYTDADPSLQLQDFYEEVSTPVLADVTIKYLGNSVDPNTVTDTDFSTYFMGSEIVVAGKLQDDDVSNVISQVSGHSSTGYMEMDLSVSVARMESKFKRHYFPRFTEKLWAYLTIKKLLDTMLGTTDEIVKENAKQRALELSLKYGFVTPLTSMVVTKPEDELDEDEIDDIPKPSSSKPKPKKASRRAQNKQRSAPKSFVDNDPHFVVRVKGVEEGICFDVNGQPGDVFQLLYDKHNDIVINGQVNAPDLQPPNMSHVPTYFSTLVVMHLNAEINIGPRQITVNNKNITWKSWRTTSPVQINNIFLEFQTKNHLLIKIGDNIEFVVMRHISNVPNPRKMDYLGFYIKNGDGLHQECHGLLGQFESVLANLIYLPESEIPKGMQIKMGAIVRTLQIVPSDGSDRNVIAFLGKRRNMDLKEHVPCWHIRNNGRGLLHGHFKDYNVPDVYFKDFALQQKLISGKRNNSLKAILKK